MLFKKKVGEEIIVATITNLLSMILKHNTEVRSSRLRNPCSFPALHLSAVWLSKKPLALCPVLSSVYSA